MKMPKGPAEYPKRDKDYSLERCNEGGWMLCPVGEPPSLTIIRLYEEFVLSGIPKEFQADLGLTETEEVQVARAEDGESFVFHITRKVPIKELAGVGVRLRLK